MGVLGNRGKCAQPCRLPYELLEGEKKIDSGYLLSPRDLCGLEVMPNLINFGIDSFKIEGRMKTPEYVAQVTKIYRKYIDLYIENEKTAIENQDKKDLLQVFNRGNFSLGHLGNGPNQNLIFSEKPNNMGIYLGNVASFNENKGHVKLSLNEEILIGDTISIEGETGSYTISEIINGNQSLKFASSKSTVTIGRMKGKIKVGAKIYKMSSKELSDSLRPTYQANANFKKIPINCSIIVKHDMPISVKLSSTNIPPFYTDVEVEYKSDIVPENSINSPITKERIYEQFSKLGNTPYLLQNFDIQLDEGLHIPHISDLNDIRRKAISKFEAKVIDNFMQERKITINNRSTSSDNTFSEKIALNNRKISVLLENISLNLDYSKLTLIDNIYIPLKFFKDKNYFEIIEYLSKAFQIYVYMPTIMKNNYRNLMLNDLDKIVKQFGIKGFVVSNIAGLKFLGNYISTKKYDIVANYTMNVFNHYTIDELKKLGITTITPAIELNLSILENVINNSSLTTELIAYGREIVMNTSYCLLGKSNKCYPECKQKCNSGNKYYLKDRLGFLFPVLPDNMQTVTSIYNSKITSIDTKNFYVSSLRINILDEDIPEINHIIQEVKLGNKLEGKEYTNGNINREI